jgi:predicted ThiF/HesA family dinucleotide-utilizing enzyme
MAYPCGPLLTGHTADRTRLMSLMQRQGKQRVAMNEATFRKVNEGMEAGQDPSGLLAFVCECGRLGCNKLIQLTRAEYEDIRANPRRFAILDGHEILEAEAIVERHDRYLVVEKAGDPVAEIVEHTDPRRPLD